MGGRSIRTRPVSVSSWGHRWQGEAHMGMFDGVLGGIVGAGMVTVLNGIIEQHGGLQGVVSQFEKNGLGATVRSWVGTGPNDPISSADVHRVLGPELLQQLSAKSGLSVEELTQKLSQLLPQAVDRATPGGAIPKS
ncbi:MAG TPA: YidB family protein [Vicinamibacterales bacterium]